MNGDRREPTGLRRISLAWVVALAIVWWVLAPPASGFLAAGAVAILVGSLLHSSLGGRTGERLFPLRLAAFLPWFLGLAVRGGIDVARRALSPSLPLSPDLLDYRLRIPAGAARVFFVNAISLLPGTFSTELRDDALTVHLLAREAGDEGSLRALEDRVASLWGLALDVPERRP
jgi:multicomponent Na+:H+ antiporter subunit E